MKIGSQTSWVGGLSTSKKAGGEYTFAFAHSVNHRSDPKKLTVNPAPTTVVSSLIEGLPVAAARAGTRLFFYDETGKIYLKSGTTFTLANTVPSSQGNGLEYYAEDGNLYYAGDTTFGRLYNAQTENVFNDNFLASEGGTPTNTKSLSLNGTSQYAYVADSANNSPTGDISLEVYANPSDLPETGEEFVLASKWLKQGNQRSFKMGLVPISNYFGNGTDGALTVSVSATRTEVDSACAGTVNTNALTATHASFAPQQKILIIQMQGTNAGQYEINTIANYTAGTITTENPLKTTYSSTGTNKAQVILIKQYTDVTINAGITWTIKPWNGTVGGILVFFANGTITVNGTIDASGGDGSWVYFVSDYVPVIGGRGTGGGFRGGNACVLNRDVSPNGGYTGESYSGDSLRQFYANGGGGGGAFCYDNFSMDAAGGGGGGHTTKTYSPGYVDNGRRFGDAGNIYGSNNLSTLFLGSGGGGAYRRNAQASGGGSGGGIVFLNGVSVVMGDNGVITANGGLRGWDDNHFLRYQDCLGGDGAGGSVLIKCQTATLGSGKITANGGTKSIGWGDGGEGRVAIHYATSYTGTTSPTIVPTQDVTLANADGYALQLQVSGDGTNFNTFQWDVTSYLAQDRFWNFQTRYDTAQQIADAYIGGTHLGSKNGSQTEIYNSTASYAIGASFDDAGAAENFFPGLIDNSRLWSDNRTQAEFAAYCDQILTGNEANLIAYYKFEDNLDDSDTAGNNDLTGVDTPTYSTTIPFYGITTRSDQDQYNNQTGQTYTLATSIAETATHRQTFTPLKDPQKSIAVKVGAKGTGNWTLTVHDAQNRSITSKTLLNADLTDATYAEFTFTSVWRPLSGQTYHFHITSTVADGTVVTGTTTDLETCEFYSYFQFLINCKYHPMKQMLNFMAIGNERYLATYEPGVYDPNRITLPSGYTIRCLTYWRDYLVMGCYRGDSLSDYQEGMLFFWDGISDRYNFFIQVPEGGINAMYGTKDLLFMVTGTNGKILIYNGQGNAEEVDQIPGVEQGDTIEIAPGAMDMYQTLVSIGAAYSCDADEVYKGVYTYGKMIRENPYSLGYDYPTTLGAITSNNSKVGLLYSSGGYLYVGWQNGTNYGIDELQMGNTCYTSASMEQLITDVDTISKHKYPLFVRVDFEPLVSGMQIRPKYKSDRAESWIVGEFENTVGAKHTRMRIPGNAKEIQIGADIVTIGVSPNILGISVEVDDADGETGV